jgi:hypothetical protein
MRDDFLGQEWQTLQQCHERHEKNALLIKLVCVVVCVFGLGLQVPMAWLAFCVVLLWGQEAIFKTYQGRIADRMLRVEQLLAQAAPEQPAMQLHSEWTAQRPGFVGLMTSYASSACKPTVVFPYVPMLVFLWLQA